MVGKRLRLIFKLSVSCLLAGYLVFKVEWFQVASALKKVDVWLYLFSTLIAVGSSFLVACKYFLLIRQTSIAHPILSLIKINFISRFYSLFLPSAVGQDAVRWYKVTRNKKGRLFFMAATVFERLIFLFVLMLCGFISLSFCSTNSEIAILRTRLFPVILPALIIICVTILYFIYPPFRALLKAVIIRISPSHGKWHDIIHGLENFSLQKNNTDSVVAYVVLLSLLWQIFFIFRIFILFKAAALPLDLVDASWMGSLVLLLQVLPLSFAGIGIREGAYAYLFTLSGLAPEKGVFIGLLFFSQMLILACIGGFFELIEK